MFPWAVTYCYPEFLLPKPHACIAGDLVDPLRDCFWRKLAPSEWWAGFMRTLVASLLGRIIIHMELWAWSICRDPGRFGHPLAWMGRDFGTDITPWNFSSATLTSAEWNKLLLCSLHISHPGSSQCPQHPPHKSFQIWVSLSCFSWAPRKYLVLFLYFHGHVGNFQVIWPLLHLGNCIR